MIQGKENLPRIIFEGIHFEEKVSKAVTKSDQSSSTVQAGTFSDNLS